MAGLVGETQWHRSEQVSELEHGSLLWCAWTAQPQEMMPWIGCGGAEVEVLAPESLGQSIKAEVERLEKIYLVGDTHAN